MDLDGAASVSGERTRLACSVRRLAERFLGGAQGGFVPLIKVDAARASRRGAANNMRAACAPQNVVEIPSRMGRFDFRQRFRSSGRHELSTFISRFGTKIDDPI